MAGFIPTCHTQTSVEVAKLEIFMIEIPSAIGLLIVLYFCRSDKPSKRKLWDGWCSQSNCYRLATAHCPSTAPVQTIA